jgi:peptidyl-prolyl cis-trans isomerase C
MKHTSRYLPHFALFAALFPAAFSMPAIAEGAGVATIDGEPVSYEEFERMVYSEARQTFYHAAPPDEATFLAFRREVADKLVNRKLKLQEARRRGLEPDQEYVGLELAKLEAQYAGTEQWESDSETMLKELRVYFEEDSLLEQIDAALRRVEVPSEAEVRAYYEANIDKFTQPEQVRLSVILLGVPAWADSATWDAARENAAGILMSIREGRDFADAAREFSTDPSAGNGGDMGYLHAGVLDGELAQVVSQLGDGEMADRPVTVLEGVVIVRVEGRRAPQVNALKKVRERATGLWRRDAEQSAYEAAIARLRNASEIVMDETYLEKLPN